MEVRVVGKSTRPVGIDVGHVHPGSKGAGEAVEETFLGFVDLGHTQDIVNIRDEGDTLRGDKEGSGIAAVRAIGMNVEALNVIGLVTGCEAVQLDGYEDVKVAQFGSLVGKGKGLGSARCLDRVTATRLTVGALHGRRLKAHGNILVALLDNENGAGEVACLFLLVLRQLFNASIDQEDIGQVVDLFLIDIRELVDIAVEADVPALVCPVRIRGNVENLSRLRGQIIIANVERLEDLRAGREAFEPSRNA